MAQQAYFDPPVLAMDAEVPPTVPDVESTPNEVRIAEAVRDASWSYDVVKEPPQEILLTQNHPSRCLFRIVLWSLPPLFIHLSHSFLLFHIMLQETFPQMWMFLLLMLKCPLDGLRASNSVDSEPYEIARLVDSDDDRPVGELMESDVEMLRHIFPGCHDLRVYEFSDLTHSDLSCAEGRDDELQKALEAGLEMTIEKGRVFKDLPALKRWLQAFAVTRKRPYKVMHAYVEQRYTVVCDKERCPLRVCARKQKVDGK
jgi:hypothetical protein